MGINTLSLLLGSLSTSSKDATGQTEQNNDAVESTSSSNQLNSNEVSMNDWLAASKR